MKNMAQVAVVKYESCLSRAFFHPAPALIYSFMSVIRFSCVHCSPRSTGNKALSLSRNNVPLSICAWNNRLQRSARIAIIDHVCDVCSDIDSESLFNTDEWSLAVKPVDFLQISARSICRLIHARHEIERGIRFKCVSICLIAFRCNAMLRSVLRDMWIFRICC